MKANIVPNAIGVREVIQQIVGSIFSLPAESSTQSILFEKINEADKKMENKLSGIRGMNIIG